MKLTITAIQIASIYDRPSEKNIDWLIFRCKDVMRSINWGSENNNIEIILYDAEFNVEEKFRGRGVKDVYIREFENDSTENLTFIRSKWRMIDRRISLVYLYCS